MRAAVFTGPGERLSIQDIDKPVIADDEMLSALNIKGLMDLFGSSRKRVIEVVPGEHGLKRVGHLGFFREEFAPTLWQKVLLPQLQEDEITP